MSTFLKSAFAELWKAICSKLAILLITGVASIITIFINEHRTDNKIEDMKATIFSIQYMNGAIADKDIVEDVMKPILDNCGMFSSFVWTQYNSKTEYLHFKDVRYLTDAGYSSEGSNNPLFKPKLIDSKTFEYFNNIEVDEVKFIDKNSEYWNIVFLEDYKEKSWQATNDRLHNTLNQKTKQSIMRENDGYITFNLGSLYIATIKDHNFGLIYVLFLSLPNERKACYRELGNQEAHFKTKQAMLEARNQIKNKIFNQKI